MVICPGDRIRARILDKVRAFVFAGVLAATVFGCASADQGRLKQSREHFMSGDAGGAEALLYSQEVLEHSESRLQHYLWLGSVAMSQGLFEKALFYFERGRALALELRSDRGGFDWFSKDYKSNPVEFSHLHAYLVLANLLLAEAGKSPAWSIPELKLRNGTILFPAQNFPARVYSAAQIAEFQTRARAELLAWDQFLTTLKRTYPDQKFFREDFFAKLLAGYVHGGSATPRERRTGELLLTDAKEHFDAISEGLPSLGGDSPGLQGLLDRMLVRSRAKPGTKNGSLFLAETGILPAYKKKRIVIGVSLLFKGIEDPVLRAQLEQIGFRVLLQFAPEFGLIAFTGAMVGAASAEDDDAPKFLSDAVDQGLGIEMAFPSMAYPDPAMKAVLEIKEGAKAPVDVPLQVLNPVQEVFARELKARMEEEWSKKALKVGIEYLAILIPAVKAYQAADQEQNFLKKLAILAGYFMAKKALDRMNEPDLRSWALLPKVWFGEQLDLEPGSYAAKLRVRSEGAERTFDLGALELRPGGGQVLYRRVIAPPTRAPGLP